MKHGVSITYDSSSGESRREFGIMSRGEDMYMSLVSIIEYLDHQVVVGINDDATVDRIRRGVMDILYNYNLGNLDGI